MVLYLNGHKHKIYLNNKAVKINMISPGGGDVPVEPTYGEGLMSSDNYILMSLDDLYLIPKGSEN